MLDQVRRSIRSLVRLNRISGVIYSLVVPTLVGVFAVYYPDFAKVNIFLFWFPVIVLSITAAIFAFHAWETPLAAEYYIEMEDAKKSNDKLTADIRYMSLLQEQISAWTIMVRTFQTDRIEEAEYLKTSIANICDGIVESRDDYFTFRWNELWNFAVYCWDDEKKLLVPLWRQKHHRHPSRDMGRSWPDGEGHVGHAFRRRETIITPDAQLPDVKVLMASTGNEKPYDEQVYRSYVSQPITQLDPDARAYGVLVATSNYPGRFDKANALVLHHAAAVLASTIQLAYDS